MFAKCLFVLCQIIVFVGGAPPRILHSPCPEIFTYERMTLNGNYDWMFPPEDHRWRGVVTVPPSLPISLKVKLLLPVVLSSKYAGRIELAEDKNEIVRKMNTGSIDKIKYYVYFPAKFPIPQLILISVNSRVLCSQSPAPKRLRTILTLEHSLVASKGQATFGGGISGRGKPFPGKDLNNKNLNSLRHCGRGVLKGHVTTGNASISNRDWPWMVPLFRKTESGPQFLCSSTLISYQFVVTAAHCMKFKNSEMMKKEDVVAYVGKFDIQNETEDGSQPRSLSGIFIHPDFNPQTLYSDLALLRFSRPVQFSPRVSPACLWQGNDDLGEVVGLKGVVFGWGMDGLGHKITPTPNLAVMPIVSQEECLRSKMEFVFLTSNRTLCAGFRNGTGPCNGDSGGGLLIPVREETGVIRWILRGIISLSLLENNQLTCDLHEYTVFTDVAKFQTWILEQMEVKESQTH